MLTFLLRASAVLSPAVYISEDTGAGRRRRLVGTESEFSHVPPPEAEAPCTARQYCLSPVCIKDRRLSGVPEALPPSIRPRNIGHLANESSPVFNGCFFEAQSTSDAKSS